eukprot:m.96612 g.96612  ORF g.96612 m.96612 type:complete len:78 (+) comp26910_c0_seq3:2759-2992(+)
MLDEFLVRRTGRHLQTKWLRDVALSGVQKINSLKCHFAHESKTTSSIAACWTSPFYLMSKQNGFDGWNWCGVVWRKD